MADAVEEEATGEVRKVMMIASEITTTTVTVTETGAGTQATND
jgi:hypothetical protein